MRPRRPERRRYNLDCQIEKAMMQTFFKGKIIPKWMKRKKIKAGVAVLEYTDPKPLTP